MTTFLSMSLSAGVLILITALLRRFAGNRLPRRMYIALWDIAVLRLLVPLALPKQFSISALFPAPFAMEAATESAVMQSDILVSQMTVSETPALLPGTLPDLTNVLTVLWAVVALALAVYFAAAYVRSTRAFAQSLPDDDPRCAAFLRTHPTRRRVAIRVSSRIASPLSYGLFHPVILLPKGMNRDGLPFVLEHEMMHIRALDAWRKLFVLAALCLHWFNPTVFILFLLVNRDMELLCDERVLMQRATSSKRAYALTLLDMEAARSAAPTMSCFRMTGIEERIFAMKNTQKNTPLTRLVAGTLVAASCISMISAVSAAADDKVPVMTTGDPFTVSVVNPDGSEYSYVLYDEDGVASESDVTPIEWWTVEEFEAYMEQERKDMEELVRTGARGYTSSDGWFTWTQEKLDESMALYQDTLDQLKRGMKVSKPGRISTEDVITLFQAPDSVATHREDNMLMIDADTTLYLEKDGGTVFHADPDCAAIPESARATLKTFSADQLESSPYSLLQPCPECFRSPVATENP